MIEYLLKKRGKDSVRATIAKAHAAKLASDRMTLKSAAYGKLEMLIDLDLISVRDADCIRAEIDDIHNVPPVQQEKRVTGGRKQETAPEIRCLDIGTGSPLTASEFSALIASGYIKPMPRTETAPAIQTITAAWQDGGTQND